MEKQERQIGERRQDRKDASHCGVDAWRFRRRDVPGLVFRWAIRLVGRRGAVWDTSSEGWLLFLLLMVEDATASRRRVSCGIFMLCVLNS